MIERTGPRSAFLALAAACMLLAMAGVFSMEQAVALAPHSPYSAATTSCAVCHDVHESTVARKLLGPDTKDPDWLTESDVCFSCHGTGGTTSWDVETVLLPNSFGLITGSGHNVRLTPPDLPTDLTSHCSSCHGPHGDPATDFDLPKKGIVVDSVTVTPTDRVTWCTACHNTKHSWYVSTGAGTSANYETSITSPTRVDDVASDYNHYPTLGTFPGSDHYMDADDSVEATTAHFAIRSGIVMSLVDPSQEATRTTGDCLWCHASHRSSEPYDAVLKDYRPSTEDDKGSDGSAGSYAQACFECHGNSSIDATPLNSSDDVYISANPSVPYNNAYWATTAGARNIYLLVSDSTNPTRTGHQVRSSDAYYEPGSPLPCYECHNPHGSKNGNTTMISDALGGNLNPRGTAAQVRQFCFSCHTTGDGTPSGWDSDSNNDGVHTDGVYTTTLANTAVGTTAVGISRTVAPPTSYLRLSGSPYHLQAATQSCLACHDDAHNPGSGASNGGKDCYICHSTYMDYMEDGTDRDTGDTEAGVGSSRTTQYHHVMGSATKDGDEAVGGTDTGNFSNYPAAGTDVYCVSCHVDHDKFNASKSSSLRSTIAGTDTAPGSVTAASSDFNATSGGVCLGCHYLSRTKDTTNQKSDGTSVTPVIPDTTADTLVAATTAYDNSPHQYGVTGRARGDNTTFSGDCSKCHSDGQTGLFYKTATTGNEFGLHYDSSRRILEALGRGTVSDPYAEERFCYSCHSTTAAGFKTTADRDWYGVGLMDDGQAVENSQNIYAQMGPSAAWRTTSTNQLYFEPSSEQSVSGNQPSGDQASDTYAGGAWQARAMSPGQATVSYESYNTTNETVTGSAGGTTQNWRRVRFVSPPVATTTSVSAAAWTVSIYARESSANANAFLRPHIYVWRADNSTRVNIVTPANLNTEFGTTALPGAVKTSATAAGTAVTLQPGDKIVVDVAIQTSAVTTGGSYQLAYSWGASAQGYLQSPVSIPWSVPSGAGHLVDSYAGLHKPAQVDESRTYIRDNKHVECADCHSPHAAGGTLHTVGSANGNAIGTNSPLQGVWGVQPSTWPTWASPGSGAYNVVSPATKEYQICFKCHSGYNSAYTAGAVGANGTWSNGWGSSGVDLWTDVALEFNTTSNASFHPVAGGTGNNSTWLNSRMLSPWLTVNQTMTCSDCHQATNAASTAYGPHGSAVKKVLRGYWPTNSADGTGAYWTIGTRDDANLLCWKCHNRANFTSWTTVHQTNHMMVNMSGYRCVDCHLVVPHGGKLAGLIGDGNGQMPSRYARANDRTNTIFTGYTAPGTDASDCGVSCGNWAHSSTDGADW